MTNTALARFLVSLGSLNHYQSSLAQTKAALDQQSHLPLYQNGDDVAIFEDALKGIRAAQGTGFNVAGIIAINRAFDSNSKEQPERPGHLRNGELATEDAIQVTINSRTGSAYYPPKVVTKMDLQLIVDEFGQSNQEERDAWAVFARLAKLQPFQDGNKRTALIAANSALNTWSQATYLTLPFDELDRIDLLTDLLRFDLAKTPSAEQRAFAKMLTTLPSRKDRLTQLRQPIPEEPVADSDARPYRLKPLFRDL